MFLILIVFSKKHFSGNNRASGITFYRIFVNSFYHRLLY